MRRILPLVMALVALLLPAAARSQEKPELPVFTRNVLEVKEPDVKVAYPSITIPGALMGMQGNARDFNAKMKARAEKTRDDFLKQVKEMSGRSTLPGEDELEVGYEVVENTGTLIALRFQLFQELRGNAHPLEEVTTVNYDLAGRQLTVQGLFQDEARGLAAAAAAVKADLAELARRDDYPLFEEGLAPKASNYENFLITRQGLRFFFNPAQAAPGYVGVVEATVPWTKAEGLLSKEARALKDSIR